MLVFSDTADVLGEVVVVVILRKQLLKDFRGDELGQVIDRSFCRTAAESDGSQR